jgi:hypothetical protein
LLIIILQVFCQFTLLLRETVTVSRDIPVQHALANDVMHLSELAAAAVDMLGFAGRVKGR